MLLLKTICCMFVLSIVLTCLVFVCAWMAYNVLKMVFEVEFIDPDVVIVKYEQYSEIEYSIKIDLLKKKYEK